ncbi:hypothetical protein [Sphingomonas sp.]|uniref:hypothetical protein n=1 Tax=Sphingomonas sp. TaxID=28214 RepID=UPI0025CD077F|nr:hypothetical protein [Sphingomonas sp.]
MKVQSSGETASIEYGVVQLAFDLKGSNAAYLIISTPEDGDPDEFFGSDHYVEVKDQRYGRYGGLEKLAVLNDSSFAVRLSTEVPEVGQEITITTAHPMSSELIRHLRKLER